MRRARTQPWSIPCAMVGMLTACSSGGDARCVPGQSSTCACVGGKVGAQECRADGTFAACKCPEEQGNPEEADMSGPPEGDGDPVTVKRRVFVTGATYSGNLKGIGAAQSGLAGADNGCANAASAAGLGGSWRAWISNGQTSAIDRIKDVGPWYLIDGTKVFNNRAALATIPLARIKISETGKELGFDNTMVWTGTQTGGSRAGGAEGEVYCDSWNSEQRDYGGVIGDLQTLNEWTYKSGALPCYLSAHLYCIEQ